MKRIRTRDIENRVISLLLLGAENDDIAISIGVSVDRVKKVFSILFKRYNICTGCKRIKLAVMMGPRPNYLVKES
jgi:hypothetical protein